MPKLFYNLWLCPNCETLNPQTLCTCEVCGEDMPAELRPPLIKTFTTSAKRVKDNELIIVSWETENAKYVSLNGVRVSTHGMKELPATESLILKATNTIGKIEKILNIEVLHVLEIYNFTVSNKKIKYGKKCKLSWKGNNIKRVLFEGSIYAASFPISFTPFESRKYSIVFEGTNDTKIVKDFYIDIIFPEPIIKLDIPEYGRIGETIKVIWETEYVKYVEIDGEKLPANNASYEWIYGLDGDKKNILFYGLSGEYFTKEINIRQAHSPLIRNCKLSGYKYKYGDTCYISWEGDYVLRWYIDNKSTYSSEEKEISFNVFKKELTIHFVGEDYSEIIREFQIEVIYYDPIIRFCKLSTPNPQKGIPCLIEWETEHVKKVIINHIDYPAIGIYPIIPQKNEVVPVFFVGENGNIIEKNIDIVLPPIEIVYFKSNSDNIIKGTNCSISWYTKNTDYVKINDKNFHSKDTYFFTPNKTENITAIFYGIDGSIKQRSICVNVITPKMIINHLSCSHKSIKQGESCIISWSSEYVCQVFANGKQYHANDSFSFAPQKTDNICIKFYGIDGTIQCRYVTINVKKGNGCIGCICYIFLFFFLIYVCLLIMFNFR